MKSDQPLSPLLQVSHLQKTFGSRTVLKDISFELFPGEVIVVLGPSGCGKSTLLRCINGLEEVQGGEILLGSQRLTDPGTNWTEVRQKIGMVFQSYELFGHRTVLENVLLGPLKVQKRDKREAVAQAEELLERVGLLEGKEDYPAQLSGGQKQRIAIVRALCMNPQMMLFDEVTAALDPEMVREVLDVILGLARQGMSMLLVTHEMEFARAVSDRVLFLDEGHIVESGGKDFFFEPHTERGQQFLNRFNFVTI